MPDYINEAMQDAAQEIRRKNDQIRMLKAIIAVLVLVCLLAVTVIAVMFHSKVTNERRSSDTVFAVSGVGAGGVCVVTCQPVVERRNRNQTLCAARHAAGGRSRKSRLQHRRDATLV